jgi:hypothetical protein
MYLSGTPGETGIIERNYCKFNHRTRNYRTELVNVRNIRQNNYGTQQELKKENERQTFKDTGVS